MSVAMPATYGRIHMCVSKIVNNRASGVSERGERKDECRHASGSRAHTPERTLTVRMCLQILSIKSQVHNVVEENDGLLTQVTSGKEADYEQYTIYPLHERRKNASISELYQMLKVNTALIDYRDKDLDEKCFSDIYVEDPTTKIRWLDVNIFRNQRIKSKFDVMMLEPQSTAIYYEPWIDDFYPKRSKDLETTNFTVSFKITILINTLSLL
ncbi:hypothetical protein EVAR_32788_1 [Eumeta japonica]|uniref:Uncharacterized protein n=1 Tax=Eumeta variegata TaxID=151549 RepID=A0A4C1WBJ5_EUMVA|nr:hypothetical protein EVAR_32788_1 [Eumeta japonica]